MTLSLFLGRFFGLYLIISGFFFFLQRNLLQKATAQVYEYESFIVITSLINIMIGLLIVLGHNVWKPDWTVVITLLGYLILLKGVLRLFVPHKVDKRVTVRLTKGDNPIYLGIICLIIGLFLTYEVFFSLLT